MYRVEVKIKIEEVVDDHKRQYGETEPGTRTYVWLPVRVPREYRSRLSWRLAIAVHEFILVPHELRQKVHRHVA